MVIIFLRGMYVFFDCYEVFYFNDFIIELRLYNVCQGLLEIKFYLVQMLIFGGLSVGQR